MNPVAQRVAAGDADVRVEAALGVLEPAVLQRAASSRTASRLGGLLLLFLLFGLGDGGLLLLLLLHGLLFGLLLGLLLLHGLLLLVLLLLSLRRRGLIVVVIVAAATDQCQSGRANAGPRRRLQQRPSAHRATPHPLPIASFTHQYARSLRRPERVDRLFRAVSALQIAITTVVSGRQALRLTLSQRASGQGEGRLAPVCPVERLPHLQGLRGGHGVRLAVLVPALPFAARELGLERGRHSQAEQH